ncbi:MAG: glutathione S-transferase family protein [Gammaproteobacteria bacterium]|jgi:glutathione S-transferase
MNLELISFKLCPFVQRSVITLNYKSLPYDITYIDLENPPEWFLKISPFGKVPALRVDNDAVLFESAIINEYIDDVTPGRLRPEEPMALARGRAWIEFGQQCLFDQYQLSTAKDEKVFEETLAKAEANLHKVEEILGEGPYFNGADFSLVDAAYAPLFMRYRLLEERHPLFDHAATPKLWAWGDRLLELDAVKESVVPDFDDLFFAYLHKHGHYAATAFAA